MDKITITNLRKTPLMIVEGYECIHLNVFDKYEALTLAKEILERYGEWLPVGGIDRIYQQNEQVSMWVRIGDNEPFYATYINYRFLGVDGQPIREIITHFQTIIKPEK